MAPADRTPFSPASSPAMLPLPRDFRFSFESPVLSEDAKKRGQARLLDDLTWAVTKEIGVLPFYRTNDVEAKHDPKNVRIAFNPSMEAAPQDGAQKSVRVGVHIPFLPPGEPEAVSALRLMASFGHYHPSYQHDHVDKLVVHTLPSRMTPDVLAMAAGRFDAAARAVLREKGPLTTLVLNDLKADGWSPKRIVNDVVRVMSERGGKLFLFCLESTAPQDRALFENKLRPWLVPQAKWGALVQLGPSLAPEHGVLACLFGVADEVIVMGNRLTPMSRAAASGKALRILYDRDVDIVPGVDRKSGWLGHLLHWPPARLPAQRVPTEEGLISLSDGRALFSIGAQKRLKENLLKNGAKGPDEDSAVDPTPPRFDTGWAHAARAIRHRAVVAHNLGL